MSVGIAVFTQKRFATGMSRRVIGWLALLCVCVGAHADESSQTFLLPPAERIYVENFSSQVRLLEDPTGKLTIDEVAAARFAPATLAAANVGFTDSIWWARVALRNEGASERQIFLRQTYPLIDYLDVYEQTGERQWQEHKTGDRRPFAARDIAHRDLVFPLLVPAQGSASSTCAISRKGRSISACRCSVRRSCSSR